MIPKGSAMGKPGAIAWRFTRSVPPAPGCSRPAPEPCGQGTTTQLGTRSHLHALPQDAVADHGSRGQPTPCTKHSVGPQVHIRGEVRHQVPAPQGDESDAWRHRWHVVRAQHNVTSRRETLAPHVSKRPINMSQCAWR